MKKVTHSLYAQTISNLAKLHDAAKHPESKQALTEDKMAVECALYREAPVTRPSQERNGD